MRHAARMVFVMALWMGSSRAALAAGASMTPGPASAIEAMARRGELSAEQAAYLAWLAARPETGLQVRFDSGIRRVGCHNADRLAMQQWIRAQGVELPPPPPPPSSGYLESSKFPLWVHYESQDQLWLAQLTLEAAEDSWQRQVVDYGYPAPFTAIEINDPPVLGLHLYVADTGMGGGGYTEPLSGIGTTPQADCASRVVIDPQNPQDIIGSTVAHEFNHTTQMATDCMEAISAWENFATAAQQFFFPDDYYAPYVIEVFQRYPEYPIDFWKSPASASEMVFYQYGASLFPIFLRERFAQGDQAFLRNVWYSFAQAGSVKCTETWGCSSDHLNVPDWFTALDSVLTAQGSSLDEAFDDFSVWRAITGVNDDGFHFKAGSQWAEVATAASHYLSQGASKGSFDVREYGSRYIELRPGGFAGQVRVQVDVDSSATWSGAVLAWRPGEPVRRDALSFGNGHADLTVEAQQGTERLMLVVSQHKDAQHFPGKQEYSTRRWFDYAIEPERDPDAGTGPEPSLEAGPEAGKDAATDAKHDAASDASGAPAVMEDASMGGGGCGCRTAPSTSSPFAALIGLAIATGLARRRRARP